MGEGRRSRHRQIDGPSALERDIGRGKEEANNLVIAVGKLMARRQLREGR